MKHDTAKGFVQGNDRIARMLAEPDMQASVDEVRAGMDRMDRVYAEGLAGIRKASALTQRAVADHMGVDQGSISRIENRDDMLLSTFAEYLDAVGAEHVVIVASVKGVEIEMPLDQYLHASQKAQDGVATTLTS